MRRRRIAALPAPTAHTTAHRRCPGSPNRDRAAPSRRDSPARSPRPPRHRPSPPLVAAAPLALAQRPFRHDGRQSLVPENRPIVRSRPQPRNARQTAHRRRLRPLPAGQSGRQADDQPVDAPCLLPNPGVRPGPLLVADRRQGRGIRPSSSPWRRPRGAHRRRDPWRGRRGLSPGRLELDALRVVRHLSGSQATMVVDPELRDLGRRFENGRGLLGDLLRPAGRQRRALRVVESGAASARASTSKRAPVTLFVSSAGLENDRVRRHREPVLASWREAVSARALVPPGRVAI